MTLGQLEDREWKLAALLNKWRRLGMRRFVRRTGAKWTTCWGHPPTTREEAERLTLARIRKLSVEYAAVCIELDRRRASKAA